MAVNINRPCYCNRDDVKRALDIEGLTATSNDRLDRAMTTVAETIDSQMHRVFYPLDTSRFMDWPNYQYAYPWQIYFEQWDLIAATAIESPRGTAVPLNFVFLEPVNRKPGFPYEWMELDRSTNAAWGMGPTPQHSIYVTGTWGFGADHDPAGTLTASIGTGDATISVSDSSLSGPGDVLILDPGTSSAPYPTYPGTAGAIGALTGERVLVTGRSAVTASLTQSGSGCTTASSADNLLAVTGAGSLNAGEVILLDSERMLIQEISGGGVATVKRAWDGTDLAAHSAATVYAYRTLSVLRGQLGTAAASHSNGATVARHRPPPIIRDLAIAETLNQVLQEGSGYARTVGSGETAMAAPGMGLAEKWDEARAAYGRKARKLAI
jgi:hypothetical protein